MLNEPFEVYAVVCDHCRNFVFRYETAEDGDIICYDCIEKMMEEEHELQKTG